MRRTRVQLRISCVHTGLGLRGAFPSSFAHSQSHFSTLQESLPASLGAGLLGSGLVLAERLGAIAGVGSHPRTRPPAPAQPQQNPPTRHKMQNPKKPHKTLKSARLRAACALTCATR
jgi:hypothetical protein